MSNDAVNSYNVGTEEEHESRRSGGCSYHGEDNEYQTLFDALPFHLCFEYLSLKRVLAARLSCRIMAEAADSCSPDLCLFLLNKHLEKNNAHLTSSVFFSNRNNDTNN